MSPIERSAGGSGGGGFANPMTTAGDIIIENAVPAPARLAIGSAGQVLGVSGGLPAWEAGAIGGSSLVYRYTVTGSDKTSIDTGVDTADAGSNDWTNGDVLEVCLIARTDKAAVTDEVDVILNNDSSAIYDRMALQGTSAGAAASGAVAETSMRCNVHAATGSTGYPGMVALVIPDFAGTTFWKIAAGPSNIPDQTNANQIVFYRSYGYRSTSAITRLAATAIAGQKLKVGSQLLIHKRLAS